MRIVPDFPAKFRDALQNATVATLAVPIALVLSAIWWRYGYGAMLATAVGFNQLISVLEQRYCHPALQDDPDQNRSPTD